MTTEIIVKAHCSGDKEVDVRISGEGEEYHTLQDGEEKEFYVYDNREILVKEVEKS